MTSPEPARHSLYSRLRDILGSDDADTLMTYLPRDRADEVATKADIASLESRLDRFDERVDARFDRLEQRIDQMQRTYVVTVVSSMTALTAIFTMVVGLLG